MKNLWLSADSLHAGRDSCQKPALELPQASRFLTFWR